MRQLCVVLAAFSLAACSGSSTSSSSGSSGTGSSSTGSSTSGTSSSTGGSTSSGTTTSSSSSGSTGAPGFVVYTDPAAPTYVAQLEFDHHNPDSQTIFGEPDGGDPWNQSYTDRTFTLSQDQGALHADASLQYAVSGNVITLTSSANATSDANNNSVTGTAQLGNFFLCYRAPGSQQVDFTFACSGNVSGTGDSYDVLIAITDDLGSDLCANGLVADQGQVMQNSGWSPAGGTRTLDVDSSTGEACFLGMNTNLLIRSYALAGDVNGQAGTAHVDSVITITATPH